VAADAATHPWLHDLPPVLSGAVGSYLGVPLLLVDGTTVGVLCVYGPQPRDWTGADVTLTCAVADVVTLELRRLDAA
jgi:GAF domain-containing protein